MSVVEVRPRGRKAGSGVMRWVMLFAFLFAPCSACDPLGRGDEPPAAEGEVFLHLEEAFAIQLPEGLTVKGLVSWNAGHFLLWGEDRAFVWDRAAGRLRQLGNDRISRPVGGTVGSPGEPIQVVDGINGRIQRFSGNGRWTEEIVLDTPLPLTAAMWTRCGWGVLAAGSDGTASELVLLDDVGRRRWIRKLGDLFPGELQAAVVNSSKRGILITEAPSPHRILLLDCEGETLLGPLTPGPLSSERGERWVAMSTVQLGGFLLQTLSDVRSDQRTLALFDQGGSLIRSTSVELPMGFVSVSEQPEFLLGLRDFGLAAEVVGYSWESWPGMEGWTGPTTRPDGDG